MKFHQSVVILLLVLCASLSTDAQPADVRRQYDNFRNQHVNVGMRDTMCDTVIQDRNIWDRKTNACKPVNTFIRATDAVINAVCGLGGTRLGGNLYRSNNPFYVVTCRHDRGDIHTGCQHWAKASTVRIVLACERGWPVHFQRVENYP